MPGSEGGDWKRAAKAAPRQSPTLPPVRFDERGVETERQPPRHSSTLLMEYEIRPGDCMHASGVPPQRPRDQTLWVDNLAVGMESTSARSGASRNADL
jgi:hypothetical protein